MGRCIAGFARASPEPAIALARPPEGCTLRFGFDDFSDDSEPRRRQMFLSLVCGGEAEMNDGCPSSETGDETIRGGGDSTASGGVGVGISMDAVDTWDSGRSNIVLVSEVDGSSGIGRLGGHRAPGERSWSSAVSACVPNDNARLFPSFMRSENARRAFPSSSSLGYSGFMRCNCVFIASEVGRCTLSGDGGRRSSDSLESEVRTRRGLLLVQVDDDDDDGATLVAARRWPFLSWSTTDFCDPFGCLVNLESKDGIRDVR